MVSRRRLTLLFLIFVAAIVGLSWAQGHDDLGSVLKAVLSRSGPTMREAKTVAVVSALAESRDEEAVWRIGGGRQAVVCLQWRGADQSLEMTFSLSEYFVFLADDEAGLEDLVDAIEPVFKPNAFYVFIVENISDARSLHALSYNSSFKRAMNLAFVARTSPSGGGPFQVIVPLRMARSQLEVVDVFDRADFATGRPDLFEPFSLDLEGRPIRVTTFEYPPFIYEHFQEDGSIQYSGFEITLLNVLAESLNFVTDMRRPEDGGMWGSYIEANHTLTGMRGDLQFERTDIGIADLYVMLESATLLDFTAPYNYDGFCFLVAKTDPPKNWLALVQPLSLTTWLLFIATQVAGVAIMYYYAAAWGEAVLGLRRHKIINFVLGTIFGEPFEFRPKLVSIRVALGPLMLGTSIVVYGYSSTLLSFLTIHITPTPMEKMEEILDIPNMQVGNYAYDINMTTEFLKSTNPKHRELVHRYEPFSDASYAYSKVSSRELAIVESSLQHAYTIRKKFTDRFGRSSLTVMDECWQSFFAIAFGLSKHSLLKPVLSRKMMQVKEAGLVSKWLGDEMDRVARQSKVNQVEVSTTALSLDDLRVPFMVLAAGGAGLAVVAFAGELCGDGGGSREGKREKTEQKVNLETAGGRSMYYGEVSVADLGYLKR